MWEEIIQKYFTTTLNKQIWKEKHCAAPNFNLFKKAEMSVWAPGWPCRASVLPSNQTSLLVFRDNSPRTVNNASWHSVSGAASLRGPADNFTHLGRVSQSPLVSLPTQSLQPSNPPAQNGKWGHLWHRTPPNPLNPPKPPISRALR